MWHHFYIIYPHGARSASGELIINLVSFSRLVPCGTHTHTHTHIHTCVCVCIYIYIYIYIYINTVYNCIYNIKYSIQLYTCSRLFGTLTVYASQDIRSCLQVSQDIRSCEKSAVCKLFSSQDLMETGPDVL